MDGRRSAQIASLVWWKVRPGALVPGALRLYKMTAAGGNGPVAA